MLKDLSPDQILSLAFIGSHMGGIAHNINTPLAAIMGRMELLQIRLGKIKSALGDVGNIELEKCFSDLSIISQCCMTIDGILKNCVRISSGILKSRTADIQLDELMKNVLTFFTADMEFKHQITKKFELDEPIPPLTADPLDFFLAFFEILQNACSAMLGATEKKLTIMMSAESQSIKIIFFDTGCGISPKQRLQLLNILQSPQTSMACKSTDTGLQRVARLLSEYGVTYDLQSMPGETFFSLRIPLR